jgi:hypothetical protein
MSWINYTISINLLNTAELASTMKQMNDIFDPIKTILEITVIIIAGFWAWHKYREFREFKHWIQFDLDANIYPLSDNIETKSYDWDSDGNLNESFETHTHLLELLFKFDNKGKTRVKIYNIQAEISTLPSQDPKDSPIIDLESIQLDKKDNHLKLCRRRTGNIVPEDIKFYYIEPQVEQIITYLTLIKKPKDIIRIKGKFCQDQRRIYPKKETLRKHFKNDIFNCLCAMIERRKRDPIYGWILNIIYKKYCIRLLSHTTERTFYLDDKGFFKK